MKKWHLLVSIAIVAILLIFGFLLSQDFLARLFWQKYDLADVALLLNRRDVELALQLGNYYFGGGTYDLDSAKKAYRNAVAINPKILWGHYQLARIYFLKGEYKNALDEINKELEANPENLRSLYVRGLIYGYRNLPGDLEKAAEDFERFTLWAPKEWAGYNDLAWILSRTRKYEEAKAVIERAFGEVPDMENNPWLWNSFGVAELNLGEYAVAKASFEKAEELAKNLTASEWRRAYPGNNPASAEEGLSTFIAAVEENLRRAESRK